MSETKMGVALEQAREIAWRDEECIYCMERDIECNDCEGLLALAQTYRAYAAQRLRDAAQDSAFLGCLEERPEIRTRIKDWLRALADQEDAGTGQESERESPRVIDEEILEAMSEPRPTQESSDGWVSVVRESLEEIRARTLPFGRVGQFAIRALEALPDPPTEAPKGGDS